MSQSQEQFPQHPTPTNISIEAQRAAASAGEHNLTNANAVRTYVSRGGLKLEHALREFQLNITDYICADLGCSTGGFTDCLLQHGAARVYSVDTAYGELAWKLRKDPRVVVTERTNALHAVPPVGGVNLVVADLSWTPQRLVLPAALAWMAPGARCVTLIKPHYETKEVGMGPVPRGGVLDAQTAQEVTDRVVALFPGWGGRVLGVTRSPILGGAGKGGKGKGGGNTEYLALLERATT